MNPPDIAFPTLLQDFFLRRLIAERGGQRAHHRQLSRHLRTPSYNTLNSAPAVRLPP